jgi:hypothetical protein
MDGGGESMYNKLILRRSGRLGEGSKEEKGSRSLIIVDEAKFKLV